MLPSGESQAHAEISTELQSKIEKAAGALIKDENAEITKAILRLSILLKIFKELLLK